MKKVRVYIKTPGKVLSYDDQIGIRTPTYFDIEKDKVQSFKQYLNLHGIQEDGYTIKPLMPDDIKDDPPKTPKRKGLKSIYLTGAGLPKIKMKVGV